MEENTEKVEEQSSARESVLNWRKSVNDDMRADRLSLLKVMNAVNTAFKEYFENDFSDKAVVMSAIEETVEILSIDSITHEEFDQFIDVDNDKGAFAELYHSI